MNQSEQKAENLLSKVNVLGVGVSPVNLDSATQSILDFSERKICSYVCVTGVHGVMEAQRNDRFREILNDAFLNVPDGMPMSWVGWLQGHRKMDRVYGPDLMLRVSDEGRTKGVRHFYYGGNDGVAELLREKMSMRFPGILVVGTYTPPFRELNEEERCYLIQLLDEVKPDIVWIGLSTPKQERFAASHAGILNAKLLIAVGAAFDFHAGLISQAPRWMQRSGLEWLYRLAMEPRRLWKRYLINNPVFVFKIFCQITGLKKQALF
jgi:N-acetylglucosaminyldiphosphoundecaprenol N-acetyl-beta-D-mannosaminyltransferase